MHQVVTGDETLALQSAAVNLAIRSLEIVERKSLSAKLPAQHQDIQTF